MEASWTGGPEATIPDVEIGDEMLTWHPVPLEIRNGGRNVVVAIAAIVEGSVPWQSPDPRLLEAIAKALQEAGDVTSERAADSV